MTYLTNRVANSSVWCLRQLHFVYKKTLSALLGPTCRFWPPCSDYAVEAIGKHGWRQGLFLALRRVLRCHPWCAGGCDPVP